MQVNLAMRRGSLVGWYHAFDDMVKKVAIRVGVPYMTVLARVKSPGE